MQSLKMKKTMAKMLLCLALLTAAACGEKKDNSKDFVETAAGLNMKMVYVEGLSDAQGHYYIGECEITQEQWKKVMGTSIIQQARKAGYYSHTDKGDSIYAYGIGSTYPMYYVNWDEAMAFCQQLSRLSGKTYCLPTEAQWEYAARGGKYADFEEEHISDVNCSPFLHPKRFIKQKIRQMKFNARTWYWNNSDNSTHPVKSKQANNLGLYDTSGNVWEWCADGDDTHRIVRGGCWINDALYCSVLYRDGFNRSKFRTPFTGFRVVAIP